MGLHSNEVLENRDQKEKRGSVRNADRLAAFASGNGDGGADWGGCDSERLQTVVVMITQMGGAVTFGLSRDLGAHSVTLMLGKERKTLWFNGNADLDNELDAVAATLATMT